MTDPSDSTTQNRASLSEADKGRALVNRLFSLVRLSPEWEQALAELRAWSMLEWEAPKAEEEGSPNA